MSDYPAYDSTAHCRLPGVDPARFHPPTGVQPHTLSVTKKLCTGGGKIPACPFLEPCREYSLHNAISGIWGGLGSVERRAIRRARRIVPQPLSMGVIAAVSRSEARTEWFTVKPCPECGKEMNPKTIRRHIRSVHERKAA